MKRLSSSIFLIVLIAATIMAGCATTELAPPVDGDSSSCPAGSLGCPCLDDNSCAGDLVCQNDVCIRAADGDDDDAVETDTDSIDKDTADGDIEVVEIDPDSEENAEDDAVDDAEPGPCTPGDLRCGPDGSAVETCTADAEWKVSELCECGTCEDNRCVRALCPYEFDHCKDEATVIVSTGDDTCCPPMEEPCATGYVCDESAGACILPGTDGDVDDIVETETEEDVNPCDDDDPCTYDFMEDGQCRHSGIGCNQDNNPCTSNVCDSADGQCKPQFVPDGECPQNDNPCSVAACSNISMSCTERPDAQGSCDDADPCNGQEYCDGMECKSSDPVTCDDCYSCDPDNGQCYCDGSCTEETCNGIDDNCNDQVDEGGVCNPPGGLRIEVSWSNLLSDINLHVLRPGGVFGTDNQVDPNDCYYNNTNPDWGVPGDPDDNPFYSVNETSGRGENNNPETVTVALPENTPYRVLVHYARFTGIQGVLDDATVWVKVFFNDVQVASEATTLTGANTFWNVFCIKYGDNQVNLIETDEGNYEIANSIQNIDSQACMSSGQPCQTPCDCPQGLACVNNVCEDTGTPVYCCEHNNCPPGGECYSSTRDKTGMCGFSVDFDHKPNGDAIATFDPIVGVYNSWGVRFSTTRPGATVVADGWELESDSGGNSCGTLDNDGDRWLGTIWIEFMTPSSTGSSITRLGTYDVSFFSGETHVNNGLRVQALNINNDLIYETYINSSRKVVIHTEQPITRLRVEPNNDPDFVIDDVQVPYLLLVP